LPTHSRISVYEGKAETETRIFSGSEHSGAHWQSPKPDPVNFRVAPAPAQASTGRQDIRAHNLEFIDSANDAWTMEPAQPTCAILADRHLGVAEGVRGLLESAFQTVYAVADLESLREGVQRLAPALIVLDLSLAGCDFAPVLQKIRELSPTSWVIVLTLYDQAAVARLALEAGADSVVLKRCAGSDFMPAVDAVLRGETFVSPDFGPLLH
jgi:CheY-like chemotaxis protein